jgi:hypothetical protein
MKCIPMRSKPVVRRARPNRSARPVVETVEPRRLLSGAQALGSVSPTIKHAPLVTIKHAPLVTIKHAPLVTIKHAPLVAIKHAPV